MTGIKLLRYSVFLKNGLLKGERSASHKINAMPRSPRAGDVTQPVSHISSPAQSRRAIQAPFEPRYRGKHGNAPQHSSE
jgi:hypothetical protein